MNRQEAEAIVYPLAVQVGPYSGVPLSAAMALLGEYRYGRMLRDPIRRAGPSKGTVYPWNVVDFMLPIRLEPLPQSG